MWLDGGFEDQRMMVVEFTIGYAFEEAFIFIPGENPRVFPLTMVLSMVGMGKTLVRKNVGLAERVESNYGAIS